jgi:large subunit ribosomal protein L18e
MKATNPLLRDEARMLQKASRANNAEIWMTLSEKLSQSKMRRASVNLSRISRSIKEGETAAVPGKVLGAGVPGKISVAAFGFSGTARKKIEDTGGECLSFKELIDRNPKGAGVRIIA